MPSLYEISENIRSILDRADPETGELGPEDTAALTALEMSFPLKAEAVALFIRELQSEADGVDEEAKRLAGMVKSRKNRADRLKAYLFDNMKAQGLDKIKGKLCTVAIQNSPQCVNVTDAKIIPASYWQPADPILNKSVLLADMKAGQVVPGAEIAQGQHLRIR